MTDLNYEIAYYSLSGNTEKLAYGIAKRLPENQAFLTNLQEEEVTLAADVYLVGFGINNGTVPLKVMERIEPAGRKEDIPVCDLRHRAK